MIGLGYELVERHEHEFRSGEFCVELGAIDTFLEFAGIDLKTLRIENCDGVSFAMPTREQYLSIYRASFQDSYRNERNSDKDFPMIAFFEEILGK